MKPHSHHTGYYSRLLARVGAFVALPASVVAPAAALLALSASVASAQVIRGTLTEQGTGVPVEGAMIVLLDPAERTVTGSLTDAAGGFVIEAPFPGRYTLRADRIGHASTVSPVLVVAVGDTVVVPMTAPVQAVVLAEVRVEADQRCEARPQDGVHTARVWEEARKALAAAVWTESKGIYRYDVLKYARDLDPSARRVLAEERSYDELFLPAPFRSVPAQELASEGFVRPAGDGDMYYAPDAEVLLSDEFLDTHCFRVRSGSDEASGLLGLSFEPLPERKLPDIEGVFWLDPQTGRLRWLEFTYRNLRHGVRSRRLGGRVVFEALPNGTWVVQEWRIRMPLLEVTRDRFGLDTGPPRIVGLREQGGVVSRILTLGGDVVVEAESGTLEGVVLDATARRPLVGARVWLEGADRNTVTGPDGRFRIGGLHDGTYPVSFTTLELDLVGFDPEPVDVEVTKGEVAALTLLAPPAGTLVAAECRDYDLPARAGVLLGRVRDPSGRPLNGAKVRILWSGWSISSYRSDVSDPRAAAGRGGRGGVRTLISEDRQGLEVTTDERGFYIACGVPGDHPLLVAAVHGERATDEASVRVPLADFWKSYDLTVPAPPPTVPPPTEEHAGVAVRRSIAGQGFPRG